MDPIFPKHADKYLKLILIAILLGGAASVGLFAYFSRPQYTEVGYSPVQPVPYSHKLHAGNLGMDCRYCHSTVETSAPAGIPSTETCMNCHSRVKPQSALLEKVRESYSTGQPVPWVRIHRLPDFVYFNHSSHVTAGVSCVSCHGRIDQMAEVHQAKPLSMSWCLECHRNPAPNLRPREFVTKLDWVPQGDPVKLGKELMLAKNIHPPTNCSGCHR